MLEPRRVSASMLTSFLGALSWVVFWLVPMASTQAGECDVVRLDRLMPSDEASSLSEGRVAIHGSRLVIGAPEKHHTVDANIGAAYVYARSGDEWALEATLTISDLPEEDWPGFGMAVAINGDTIAVGAPHADLPGAVNAGAVYVFARSGGTWSQQAKLGYPEGVLWARFGWDVAVSGNTIAVGCPYHGTPESAEVGAVYVYVYDGGWSMQERLMPSTTSVAQEFGASVCLDGDTLVAGAPSDPHAGTWTGSATVFVRTGTTWASQARLTASDAAADDRFGWSVAIEDDTLMVSAPTADLPHTNGGRVYVFNRSGSSWSEQAKLCMLEPGTWFGRSMTLSGDLAVFGHEWKQVAGLSDAGGAYVFMRHGGTWSHVETLTAEVPFAFAEFGFAVGLDQGTLVVQAPTDRDALGNRMGAAHVFDLSPIIADNDGDDVPCRLDNCLTVSNPDQQNSDPDSLGDACDNCPLINNPGQEDGDADEHGDWCDNCPGAYNPEQEDADGDWVGDVCDLCPGTVPGAWVDWETGCPLPIHGDFDRDGDVDATDFAVFSACLSGPAIPYTPAALPDGCRVVPDEHGRIAPDHDRDGDVDQADFGPFQRCYSGENLPAYPWCD